MYNVTEVLLVYIAAGKMKFNARPGTQLPGSYCHSGVQSK